MAHILWRLLLIQGAWNFKGMQNIGFAYAMLPGLKEIHGDRAGEKAARYAGFFNTHPYMAPTIAGVFLKLEEQGRAEEADKIKPALCGSLAAMGDTFFWATLKPITALLLLLAVLVDQLWGMALVLLLYNGMHLWVMAWGFSRGYRDGPDGALALGRMLSVDRIRHVALMVPLLAGMVLAFPAPWHPGGLVGLGASVLVFLGAAVAYRLKLGVFRIFYGVFALALIWTMIT
jgi:PTS system mannose-specific IID component